MLADDLGFGPRELISFVGAGGKSTLLLRLAHELVHRGNSVVLTTTTKMGTDQIPANALVVNELEAVTGSFTFLLGSIDGPKVVGVAPGVVDRVFDSESADYVLVEADGARRRSIKAPNENEPVYPSRTSVVVVVAGLDAIGGRIGEVAHRPELVAGLLGETLAHEMTREDLVELVTNDEGGLARIPEGARVIVALTHLGTADPETAEAIGEHPRVERVVLVNRG